MERGHPRAFATGKEFEDKASEYIEYCKTEKQFANIAGFCVYNDIHKDTYYQQREYYSDSFKKVESMLENSALNNHNTAMGIFYFKNKFGYKDKIETENVNINHEMTEEEADKILKKYNISE